MSGGSIYEQQLLIWVTLVVAFPAAFAPFLKQLRLSLDYALASKEVGHFERINSAFAVNS